MINGGAGQSIIVVELAKKILASLKDSDKTGQKEEGTDETDNSTPPTYAAYATPQSSLTMTLLDPTRCC
jgi:hypothetical protein